VSDPDLIYRDSAGIAHTFETTVGDNGGRHPIHTLPTTALQNLSDTASRLATIITALTTLQGYVDQLEGFTDGLETLIGATNTALGTIATNQGVPSGGPKFGYVGSIGTGTNATFASKTLARGCVVTNLDTTNNLLISVGTPGSTDVDTYTVKPGRDSPFIAVSNANGFNMRSSASTVTACYAGA
jgi:hypothetical protein